MPPVLTALLNHAINATMWFLMTPPGQVFLVWCGISGAYFAFVLAGCLMDSQNRNRSTESFNTILTWMRWGPGLPATIVYLFHRRFGPAIGRQIRSWATPTP